MMRNGLTQVRFRRLPLPSGGIVELRADSRRSGAMRRPACKAACDSGARRRRFGLRSAGFAGERAAGLRKLAAFGPRWPVYQKIIFSGPKIKINPNDFLRNVSETEKGRKQERAVHFGNPFLFSCGCAIAREPTSDSRAPLMAPRRETARYEESEKIRRSDKMLMRGLQAESGTDMIKKIRSEMKQ